MTDAIATHSTAAPKVWGVLSEPVDPMETHLCMRAQSYLSGSLLISERCPGGSCPPLTLDHARDVLAWAGITL